MSYLREKVRVTITMHDGSKPPIKSLPWILGRRDKPVNPGIEKHISDAEAVLALLELDAAGCVEFRYHAYHAVVEG